MLYLKRDHVNLIIYMVCKIYLILHLEFLSIITTCNIWYESWKINVVLICRPPYMIVYHLLYQSLLDQFNIFKKRYSRSVGISERERQPCLYQILAFLEYRTLVILLMNYNFSFISDGVAEKQCKTQNDQWTKFNSRYKW